MPAAPELIAHARTVDEICTKIGADWLIYQDLEDLITSATEGNPDLTSFEDSVFSGNYITGDVDHDYLAALESSRNDAQKKATNSVEIIEG